MLLPKTLSYHRVLDAYRICPPGDRECWVVEYDNGEVADPSTDPLIVGALDLVDYGGTEPNPEVRIVWNDRVWKVATRSQQESIVRIADALRPQA